MESTLVTTSSEVDKVENEAISEFKSEQKENGSVDASDVATQIQNSKPESEDTANNITSEKELSWEKIAADVTESEDIHEVPESNLQSQVVADSSENYKSPTSDIQTEEISSNIEEEGALTPQLCKDEISITEADSSEQMEEVGPTSVLVDEVIDECIVNEESVPTTESDKAAGASDKTEIIEISELKPDEVITVTETIDGVEYTVVEAEDAETTEIIAEHLAQTTETIVIDTEESQNSSTVEEEGDGDKTDDSSTYVDEVYVLENKDSEALDDPGRNTKDTKPKRPRGRKPISDIPLHVLGRDITKPIEGVSNGGRIMPKPRLGVKVPYRNLTSQIVSKQEIEKEIMDRFKLKQEQSLANSGDLMFTRKLTQNLAKKLIPSEKQKNTVSPTPAKSDDSTSSESSKQPTEIQNDSDLIAILEGNDDEVNVSKQAKTPEQIKETEREIALKQLSELPNVCGEEDDDNKNKILNTRSQQEARKTLKQNIKSDSSKLSSDAAKATAAEKKKHVEVEPQLKTGMVIKTYTRKRRSTDLEQLIMPKKSTTAINTKPEDGSGNVYVTKSSRIIKKKVIWDPDEIPNKSPIKSPKPETSSNKSPIGKQPEKKIEPKIMEKKVEQIEKNAEKKIVKKEPIEKSPINKSPVAVKKITKQSPLKKLKRLTEVDKLLMDEGAVNMLYEVKNNDESNQDRMKLKSKSTISLDRAHRELMNKTNVIKNELQQSTSAELQKSLRKKEVSTPSPKKEVVTPKKEAAPTTIARKKSKDSTKNSAHSPPTSPAYNAEASRIIRRHSSSSFSSDGGAEESGVCEKVGRKRSASNAESPKKKMKKTIENKSSNKEEAKSDTEGKLNNVETSFGEFETFTATRRNKLVSIVLNYDTTKGYLSEQVLEELTTCIKELGSNDDCHVLSLTSSSERTFCRGLDYGVLLVEDETSRKKVATDLASLVKDFLTCLLNFPKVLVAGIQGDCIGLGVTMLPLFDMIIASDTSTFSTPYAKLGCIPEAGFLLTVPHLSSHGLASELFYTSQVIKADDAFRRGLVTRLCWPEKYQEELKTILSSAANQSKHGIIATKRQLRQHSIHATETALNTGSNLLVELWTSTECQKNFEKYNLDSE